MILYEYPFNERIRTYLRLEHLFRRLGELVPREHPLDHHYALATLFEVMDVAARADLKSDVMKDLEKQKAILNGYRGNPAIAEAVLDEVVGDLDTCFAALNSQPGKAGQSLTENEWLMSIRSRIGIPGGTCEFDLPGYYAWQQLDAATRQADLGRWAHCLGPLAESVHLLLKLLRDSGTAQKVMAGGRPVPADAAAGPQLPAAAPANRSCPAAGARDQRQPPDGVGAPDAPGRQRPAAAQPRECRFRTDPVFLSMASESGRPAPAGASSARSAAATACTRPSNPYRPFCSERCKSLDLGAWAAESFRVPDEAPTDDQPFGDPKLQ